MTPAPGDPPNDRPNDEARARPLADGTTGSTGSTGSSSEKIEEVYRRIVIERSAELTGMLEILGHKRKLMWLNFIAGLARGVGFFLGVSLIGALILAGIGFAFNAAVSTMGFKDLTLEQAVRAAVLKFTEVQQIVTKTQHEVETGELPLDGPAPTPTPTPDPDSGPGPVEPAPAPR